LVQRRRIIFVGCEGKSEISFVAWLYDVSNLFEGSVTFQKTQCETGNGFVVVESAVSKLKECRRKGLREYDRFVLVDNDNWRGSKRAALRLARDENLKLIIFENNFESFLGRLLSNNPQLGHANAVRELKKIWPNYSKPEDRVALRNFQDQLIEGLHSMARTDPNLNLLLTHCNIIPKNV
jgi:hypothetical protein